MTLGVFVSINVFVNQCTYTHLHVDVSGLQELIDKILQLETHNEQLRSSLAKSTDTEMEKEKATGRVRKSFDFSR